MHDRLRADVSIVTAHIDALKSTFPELADDADLLAATIEGETDFDRIMGKVGEAFLEAVSMKEGAAALSATMRDRASRFDAKAEAMRNLMLALMQAAGKDMLRLPILTVSVRPGHQSAKVTNLAELSKRQGFTKTETTPRLDEIRKALLAGADVPGAELHTGPASLAIRTK